MRTVLEALILEALIAVMLMSGVAVTQNPTVPAAESAATATARATIVPAEKATVLREGTQVKLKLTQTLNSKTALEGDPVNFVVAEDVVVDNFIVAKAGSFATGTVSHSERARTLGQPGELNIRLSHMRCGDKKVRLRGTQAKNGAGKEGTAIALTVLFGPIGLFKHGKNVEVNEGAPMIAYVDDDYTFLRGSTEQRSGE